MRQATKKELKAEKKALKAAAKAEKEESKSAKTSTSSTTSSKDSKKDDSADMDAIVEVRGWAFPGQGGRDNRPLLERAITPPDRVHLSAPRRPRSRR